ncbi:protein kinase (macronuclear) [Tetrahymena thermophila SB210]|uniref:non-specific serine/threonine protein kinase n=1 Tax=Tetrahymena thermophila (strain SB210) TaxID=312017 RepID=I7M4P3_TETTS|nr:protein kinase [Tetrahymena thermophila SB210]EAS07777.2 protein kinase [Tetrahymena thermophila SB210]|eukprot:XP_001028019.2 protein kinase [Tetrahymena thermophila SB210]
MGNQESRGQEFIEQFTRNYKFEKETIDQRLGDIKVYNRIFEEKDQVAIKVYPRLQKVNQLNTYAAFLNHNGNYIGTNINEHPNLIKLYAFKLSADEELTLYYEYCYTNLKEQIDMRAAHQFNFSSEELWRTILSVVMAGYFLETQSRHIGDVNTKKIFINKKGIVKIAPYMQSQTDIDSFKRAGFFNEYGFLSPECMEKFKQRDILCQINYIKNDIFGLGMSILEMATLQGSSSLYDWDKYEIKFEILEDRLEEARKRYGDYLYQFAQKLLQKDPYQRSTFSQLFTELLPYQQQIITGVGFSDIEIFKPSLSLSGFDSIIKKLEGYNMHLKQDSLNQGQIQGQVTTKISNLPSIYSSSEQSRISSTMNQQLNTNNLYPQQVQINLSPTLNTPKPYTYQLKQPAQVIPNESIKFKTEESESSIKNKQYIYEPTYVHPQNINQAYGSANQNVTIVNNTNNIESKPQPFIQSLEGFNPNRENILKYKVSNVYRPMNPDQRSLSPSPVLHMQLGNNLKFIHQTTPISSKAEQEVFKMTPFVKEQGSATDRIGIVQKNQININDYKKTPVPIKTITLNNILNQNVSANSIITQPGKIQTQNVILKNISQENIYNGKLNQVQAFESNLVSKKVKEPMQVQINIPVHRTNRNMIISPYPHSQRSSSPSHFMMQQRSITPNVRSTISNQQYIIVTPQSTNSQKKAITPIINGSSVQTTQTKLNEQAINDTKLKQIYKPEYVNNLSLPAETISPRFNTPANIQSNKSMNFQGFQTDRYEKLPTFQSQYENKQTQYIIQNSSSLIQNSNKNNETNQLQIKNNY